MNESEDVLRQLRWIKWLLALIASCFVLIAVSLTWGAAQLSASLRDGIGERTSLSSEETLLEQGKEQEVLTLAELREKAYPKDPYVHWLRARAYYQLGEYEAALKALRQLYDLAPTWRDEHVKPYMRAAEEKLRQKR